MVDIYVLDIEQLREKELYEQLIFYVNSKRREKINKVKQMEDRYRSLGAGLLIRFGFEKRNIQYEDVQFKLEEKGKLVTSNYPTTHFNISHTGTYVVAAFSEHPIGIDIEKVRNDDKNKRRIDLIVKKTFTDCEKEIYRKSEELHRATSFTNIWTKKESYVKAIGCGLAMDLSNLDTTKTGNYYTIALKNQMEYLITYCDLSGLESKYCIHEVTIDELLKLNRLKN